MSRHKKLQLNIAILVPMFPNIVQTYVVNHICSLREQNAMTLIVAERNPQQKEIHPSITRYHLLNNVIYINQKLPTFFSLIFSSLTAFFHYLRAAIRIFFSSLWFKRGIHYTLKSLLRASVFIHNDFSIIHSHSLFSTYDYLFLKDVFGIPITTTFHGLIPKSANMLPPGKVKQALEIADIYFVNTHFAQNQLTELGCQKGKIHIIPQGTNPADFTYTEKAIEPQKPVILLSVGRLSIEKGFHVAIEAVSRLITEYPHIRYHIVGGGPEEVHLRQIINKYGIEENVKIFGSVSTDTLRQHYADSHIFILPSIDFKDGSHTETQGVVMQEAQASGSVVIASRTGGIPEIIIDGETGLLFNERDSNQLCEKIKQLINHPELYNSLRHNGYNDIQNRFNHIMIGKQLMDIYQKLIDTTN